MTDNVRLIKTRRFGDDRGWFSETCNDAMLQAAGIDVSFVQDNHSYSGPIGTLRGIHFQRPPYAQAKLVRCTRGSVMDYAVDLRRGSPTYGKWCGATLTAEGAQQIFIPAGFAHTH